MEERMIDLVWNDVPPTAKRGRHSKYEQIAVQLRERPGEWARLNVQVKNPSNLAGQLRRRYEDIDFVVRTVDGEKFIWAKAGE